VSDLETVLRDLAAEGDDIDRLVAGLTPEQWALPTPAEGWTIFDQISHLTFIFKLAGTAAADAEAFQAMVAGAEDDFDGAVNRALELYRHLTPGELLEAWRVERAKCVAALAAVPADQVVPWLVNPLPPVILACAGIMESFGHGQDVFDALGVQREYTDRLTHLVVFSVIVWNFGYLSRGITPPDVQFRFEITAPSGELWAYGPADSPQKISGPAADFCLLVTRRRHRDDLDLTAVGAEADHWLDIAQAYRGPAGEGRRPGQFAPAKV